MRIVDEEANKNHLPGVCYRIFERYRIPQSTTGLKSSMRFWNEIISGVHSVQKSQLFFEISALAVSHVGGQTRGCKVAANKACRKTRRPYFALTRMF
ncbi:unnamed protein product [Allacma fusca]|uniref:Uncharacterized protein n=1 Tax=Allacma fusca TaxID=39272 RepID=A0A8J2Q5A3_9HEXA|nr:unnamed protein product [Allacma fusca]